MWWDWFLQEKWKPPIKLKFWGEISYILKRKIKIYNNLKSKNLGVRQRILKISNNGCAALRSSSTRKISISSINGVLEQKTWTLARLYNTYNTSYSSFSLFIFPSVKGASLIAKIQYSSQQLPIKLELILKLEQKTKKHLTVESQ